MSEYRQRWRLVLRRGEAARDLVHRDVLHLWEAAIEAAGLPGTDASRSGGVRPRLAFAAQLPARMLAEHELVDLFLPERITLSEVCARLEAVVPPGYELVDLFDVWVGEPAVAGRVVATDYRVTVAGVGRQALESAVSGVLASGHLERSARKATRAGGDLRPFILGLRVLPARQASASSEPSEQPLLWMRLLHHQELGSGRPEEVVEALAKRLDQPPAVAEIVRERIWLEGELQAAADSGSAAS